MSRRAVALALAGALLLGACTSSRGHSPAPHSPVPPPSHHARASSAVAAAETTAVRPPPAGAVFDYQLGGAYPPAAGVRVVDRDRTARPVPGRYNVCYVNAFQTQPDEASFWRTRHPGVLLRTAAGYVHDPGWPGEYLLDTSTAAKRAEIAAVMNGWFAGCARSGYQAVEPDNLDSWTRKGAAGHLTRAGNLALAALLIRSAHAHGLAIAQKNTEDVSRTGRAMGFDFAVAEECEVYRECGGYTAAYGREVIEIEYTDNPLSAYQRACHARGGRISIILRDRDVVARGASGYRYAHC